MWRAGDGGGGLDAPMTRARRAAAARRGTLIARASPPPKTLITPALFSQPPPRPPGEEGEVSLKKKKKQSGLSPLSPGGRGGGWEREGWESEGSPRRGGGSRAASADSVGLRLPLNHRLRRQRLRPLLRAHRVVRGVHGHPGVLPSLIEDVEVETEIGPAAVVEQPLLDGVRDDPLERLHAGVLGMGAAAHGLDDEERGEIVEIGLAPAGGAGGADLAIHVQAGAEDGRIAHAARDLPGEAAGRRHAADLPLGVDAVAVDRAPEVLRAEEPLARHLH